MSYVVSLKQFDGPLDLLLALISRAKLNICDIFVSEITEQYLASMDATSELDMDSASEFLQMAALLLEIKSRALLPAPPREAEEDEETPEQVLIRQLTEYKAFKELSEDMQRLELEAMALLTKLPEEYPLPPPTFELTGLTLDGLVSAFARVLKRLEDKQQLQGSGERQIMRDHYTVQSCMFRIQSKLRKNKRVMFSSLFEDAPSRSEIISVFLALLELLKLNRLTAEQSDIYGDIELIAT